MNKPGKIFLTSLMGLAALGYYACSNGENGLDGKNGKDGASCTITSNADGTTTISCPDGSSFTVKNGEKGQKGDAGSDGGNGSNGQSCKLVENNDGSQAVVCPADGSSYIVRGNIDHYANYCAPGFYGKNCENKCNCQEFEKCNEGINGDGSCSCKNDLMKGEQCDQCINELMKGENCDTCINDLMKGPDCNKCKVTAGENEMQTKDCHIYKTVTIDGQIWLAENIKETKGNNGSDLNCIANTDEDSNFVEKYGCLYTWNDAKVACPEGWHLPTGSDVNDDTTNNYEFNRLLKFVCDNAQECVVADSINKLLDGDASEGKNGTGFSALLAGIRHWDESFAEFGYSASFWSGTQNGSSSSYYFYIIPGESPAEAQYGLKSVVTGFAFSVRCVKDQN